MVLTPQVPKLAAGSIAPTFKDLKASLSNLPPEYDNAPDFDWAMHPGGATILSGAERVMNITSEHMRASYDTYMNHGNSSSATIFSVMNRLRSKDMDAIAPEGRPREYVIGCAFGPGITVEMCMLKRNMKCGTRISGLVTPPETESESSDVGDGEWAAGAGPKERRQDSGPVEAADRDRVFVAEALEHLDLD